MQQGQGTVDRREFCRGGSMGVVAAALASPLEAFAAPAKTRVALVGTGIRGSTTWGTNLLRDAGELVEIVGLCDVNPDRVKVAQRWMGGADSRVHRLRRDDPRHQARARDRHHRGRDARRLRLPRDGTGPGPDLREAALHPRLPGPADRRHAEAHRPQARRDLQRPPRSQRHEGQGAAARRRDRRPLLGRLRGVPRPRPRRQLLPALARAQAGQRHAALPQGQPPLRPAQLVDRRRTRCR